MSQQQTNITIAAPGFGGLNTELSPTEQSDMYAQVADNCVIDNFGRIAARKGFDKITADSSAMLANIPSNIYTFVGEDGSEITFVAAGSGIYRGESVIVDITPAGAAITDDNWQILTLNDKCYFIQANHDPLVFTHTGAGVGTLAVNTTNMPRATCGTSAYGRLWLADTDTDNHQVVYYSNRLDGEDFATGDAGSFNVANYWPTGFDTIKAIRVHNGRLIIFGNRSIITYNQADGDPAAAPEAGGIVLEDTIKGMGCIARDTVANIGSDVLFLDYAGIRSLGRVIEERSMPVSEVSGNIRIALRSAIQGLSSSAVKRVRSVFIPEEQLYLLIGAEEGTILAFNTAQRDETGAMRVTQWPSTNITGGSNVNGGTVFCTKAQSVTQYAGYDDAGQSYRLRYTTKFLSFGDSTLLKIPKKMDTTLVAGTNSGYSVFWSYDYSTERTSSYISLGTSDLSSEYGLAEYGIAEYTGGVSTIRKKTHLSGKGTVMQVSIEADIAGSQFSIQELNIQALIGRMI